MGLEQTILWWSLGASVLAVVCGFLLAWSIMRRHAGSEDMQAIARAIQEGATAYLKRQYTVVALVALVLVLLIGWQLGWTVAAGFVVGAVCSAFAGIFGMMVSVRANVRTTEAAKYGLREAFTIAFRGGTVTGFIVVGLALLAVTGFYWLSDGDLQGLIGLSFGGSLISIFARLGGGIFTKAADVGTDMVGKIEAGIPEDDPR
ncbi:sodium/proton-translocating pyrophosphatase, partial [Candidatus Berkelbacteria bacterium]|nr:sodium/proton-translocating pyrophosphatase [Candidatus Berkelbacteria bacterium]